MIVGEVKSDHHLRKSPLYEEGDHNTNWAVSYGDMVTLLLTFFVIFFSVEKQSGHSDLKKLQAELDAKLNPGLGVGRKPDAVWGAGNAKEEKAKDGNAQEGDAQEGDAKELEALIQGMDSTTSVKVNLQGNRLLVEFPKVSFFDSGSYVLRQEASGELRKFAQVFSKYTGQFRLIVRGYTDNQPVRITKNKSYRDNLELSSWRAIAALRELAKESIPFNKMRIGGYGETDKAEGLTPEEMRKYDRKIVLVIEPMDQTERGVSQ